MDLLAAILIWLVASLHLYFLYFEMFAWERAGPRIFRSFPKDIFPKTRAMAANQGLYNGFLSAGLVWSQLISDPLWSDRIAIFFLLCVVVAGVYGAATVTRRILYVQAAPAALALVLLFIG